MVFSVDAKKVEFYIGNCFPQLGQKVVFGCTGAPQFGQNLVAGTDGTDWRLFDLTLTDANGKPSANSLFIKEGEVKEEALRI